MVFFFLTKKGDNGRRIIPNATVESDCMVTKFVENRLHFERGQNVFDQNATLDRACEILIR